MYGFKCPFINENFLNVISKFKVTILIKGCVCVPYKTSKIHLYFQLKVKDKILFETKP